ncbi:S6A15-like protein [Mya arenaria]|uniref:S6A15-like protein n=1 Tax=Mya arenaria TaxID=6604 RepID=A0ABY7DYI5_MYAAR|nr:S6A15-like protein [Mya arenaria]
MDNFGNIKQEEMKKQIKSSDMEKPVEIEAMLGHAEDEYNSGTTPRSRMLFSSTCSTYMTLLGFSIGMSDFWRFPFLAYRNGGVLCGFPLYFLEYSVSKFSGRGPYRIWDICPIYYVLELSSGMSDFSHIQWRHVGTLVIIRVVIFCGLIKSIKSIEKVIYVTATVPFFLTVAIFIRSLMLPGAANGLIHFIYPDFEKIMQPRVWIEATLMTFYTLGFGWGGNMLLERLSSYPCLVPMDMLMQVLGDLFPKLRRIPTLIVVGLVFFMFSLPTCTGAGAYIFLWMDWYNGAWIGPIVAFVELKLQQALSPLSIWGPCEGEFEKEYKMKQSKFKNRNIFDLFVYNLFGRVREQKVDANIYKNGLI